MSLKHEGSNIDIMDVLEDKQSNTTQFLIKGPRGKGMTYTDFKRSPHGGYPASDIKLDPNQSEFNKS